MNRFLYHLVAFLVVAIWGVTFVFTKLLLMAGLTAAQIFVLRFIMAYLLLLVYTLVRKQFRLLASSWQHELLMVALGITGGSLYFLMENSAMIYTTTTNTSLIVCLCPLFAALLVALFYRSMRLHGIQIAHEAARHGTVVLVHHSYRQIFGQPLIQHRGEEEHRSQREHHHAEGIDGIPLQDTEFAHRNVENLRNTLH